MGMNLQQRLQNNSHWLVLTYALAASWLTCFNSILGELPDALIFYLALPVTVILLVKNDVREYGLTLGNWRRGLIWTVALSGLSVSITWICVRTIPEIRLYYSTEAFGPAAVLHTVAYMTAWEFFLRGFLLFGMRKFGFAAANSVQTILFFLLHIGKPGLELYSTLLTGPLFGYLTWQCRSVLPMVMIHSSIFISVVYFAGG